MTAHVTWARGGDATIETFDGESIVLRSSVPSPPGSRIEGMVAGGAPSRLRVKIHGCKRGDDGRFELRGRAIDMTREVRERIETLVVPLASA